MTTAELTTTIVGRERFAPGNDRPRHRHLLPYAIVVIRGGFDQISYAGRIRAVAGDLVVLPTLDTHANHLVSAGADILRLPWADVDDGCVYRLPDLDAVVRAAERDIRAAVDLARAATQRVRAADDLPDLLAAEVPASLGGWAVAHGVTRETVSRAFTAAYGVSARRFRAEVMTRRAWLRVVRTRESLAEIAVAAGFADQPHMTRAVRGLTGLTPARWRRDPRILGLVL